MRIYDHAVGDDLREVDSHMWCPQDGVVIREGHEPCELVHRRLWAWVLPDNEL